jgi:hypothetical protein
MNLKPRAQALEIEVQKVMRSPAFSLLPADARVALIAQAAFLVVLAERLDALERKADAYGNRPS